MEDNFGYWFSGFTDGEGHFGMQKHARSWSCRFIIALRQDDINILEEIKFNLDMGAIYLRKHDHSRDTNNCNLRCNPQAIFSIQKKSDCQNLVNIFGRYPLRAKKKKDFEIWKLAVSLLNKKLYRGPSCLDLEYQEFMPIYFNKLKEARTYAR